RQSSLAIEFFNRFIAHTDLNQQKCIKFAANLWNLSQRNSNPDTQKFAKRILTYIEIRSNSDQSFKRLYELISGSTNDTSHVSSRSSSTSNSVHSFNTGD
ncbi:unnamed protein product, partial [Adineta steineri]